MNGNTLPAWFLEEQEVETAYEFWRLAEERCEGWVTDCEPPFWGRPGRTRPELVEHFRRTDERVPAVAAFARRVRFGRRVRAGRDRVGGITDDARSATAPVRSLNVTRAIYLRLPAEAPLWRFGEEFVRAQPAEFRAALGWAAARPQESGVDGPHYILDLLQQFASGCVLDW